VRVAGALTVLAMIAFIVIMLRHERDPLRAREMGRP
jgi:hypothetical protein